MICLWCSQQNEEALLLACSNRSKKLFLKIYNRIPITTTTTTAHHFRCFRCKRGMKDHSMRWYKLSIGRQLKVKKLTEYIYILWCWLLRGTQCLFYCRLHSITQWIERDCLQQAINFIFLTFKQICTWSVEKKIIFLVITLVSYRIVKKSTNKKNIWWGV